MSEQNEMSAPEVLRDAARYIERHGWYQGDYADPYDAESETPSPKCCAVGAISMVVFGFPTGSDEAGQVFDDALELLARELGCEVDQQDQSDFIHAIAQWNDDIDRQQSEVVTTICAAAGGCS